MEHRGIEEEDEAGEIDGGLKPEREKEWDKVKEERNKWIFVQSKYLIFCIFKN